MSKPKRKRKLNPICFKEAAIMLYLWEHTRWLTGMAGKPQHKNVRGYEKSVAQMVQDEEKAQA